MVSKVKNQIKIFRERGLRKYSHFLLLKISKFFRIGFYFFEAPVKEVDIVYVSHKKDFAKLNQSINSLTFIKNIKIGTIYVISNDSNKIQALIEDKRIIPVDETSVLNFDVNHYPYPIDKNLPSRSGWLFQQLIKLGWSFQSNSENYIVLDADTYFIKPISFFDKRGRFIFFCSEEWWPPYFKSFKALFNKKPVAIWSRVAHMMIFNTNLVQKLLRELETIHNCTWHEAIANTRSIDSHSCFSEYETYANWMLLNYPRQCIARPSYNQAVSSAYPSLFSKKTISVSNHTYLS